MWNQLNIGRRRQTVTTASPATAPPVQRDTLGVYLHTPPSDQNAVDLFRGEWASKFPPPKEHISAGTVPLFHDRRLQWATHHLGGVSGRSVLELGPLEAGHSYQLESAGAASVYAVEANTRAYLKCLVAKEVLGMTRTRFGCGDFISYLEQTAQPYDLIVAAGVLYHMKDPLRTLELIAAHTRRAYIWTHYYDADRLPTDPALAHRFDGIERVPFRGRTVTLYRQSYHESLGERTFCGGGQHYSQWLDRADLFAVLGDLGFSRLTCGYDEPNHPHGPSLAIAASMDDVPPPPDPSARMAYDGHVDHVGPAVVSGWAIDFAHPFEAVSVEVLDGGRVVATVPADRHRPDLTTADKGDGHHAFHHEAAAAFAGEVTVRIVGREWTLNGGGGAIVCYCVGRALSAAAARPCRRSDPGRRAARPPATPRRVGRVPLAHPAGRLPPSPRQWGVFPRLGRRPAAGRHRRALTGTPQHGL